MEFLIFLSEMDFDYDIWYNRYNEWYSIYIMHDKAVKIT